MCVVVVHLCDGAGLGAAEVTIEDGSSSDSRSVLSTLSSCEKHISVLMCVCVCVCVILQHSLHRVFSF